MSAFNHRKYKPFVPVAMQRRKWPDKVIEQAPQWCSVDLRDGNQALIEPMTVEQKLKMFSLLVEVGFKQIEVGFPAASRPDFDFVRELIEQDLIPDDVTIQVLTQAREHLIARSFEALEGAHSAIMHVYNSTSKVQREQVFGLDKAGIVDIAVKGAESVARHAAMYPQTKWQFQYSPESFTGTELDFAVEVCNRVIEVWQPTKQNPVIINLPSTVEMATPNVYADQIEWFAEHVDSRGAVIISLHTHNDRGCAVASAELAVMAGAQRVEGTLLGNGERTGNMDIVTMAMNLYSQGVDPDLNMAEMSRIISVVEDCTNIPVHPRHPYAGDLVYTAFSGSHQDAIRKCLANHKQGDSWEVAYLPIDPADLGRSYQEVIRINSQSGKGGVAYIMEAEYGIKMPRWMQIEFSQLVQTATENTAAEVSTSQIWDLFEQRYLQQTEPFTIENYNLQRKERDIFSATLNSEGISRIIQGEADGTVEAVLMAIGPLCDHPAIDVISYEEQSIQEGSDAKAFACFRLSINNTEYSGAAIHEDTTSACINALLGGINQYAREQDRAVA